MALRWEPTHVTKHSPRISPYTSWRKRFSDHFAARLSLKKARVQKIFFSLQVNCSRARRKYSVQELRKARPELRSPEKSRGEGSFGRAHCLDRAAGAGEGGLTGGGDAGIRGGVTVDTGAKLVISWVICCNWAVRAARVVFIACSEAFCCSVSSWRWCCR